MQEHDPCREAFEAWIARMDEVPQATVASARQGEDHYYYMDLTLRWRTWREAWKARGEYHDGVRAKMKDWITHTTEVPNAD